MTKQEIQFQKRLYDLANTAYRRDIPVFTPFLERNELHILHSTKDFPYGVRYETFGGYEFAERQMAVFLPDAPFLYNQIDQMQYPFVTVKIQPVNKKFSEELGHRDFLGAVLNLGIDRSQIGDLVVEENDCILFCTPQIGTFLVENCTRIRHTHVYCEIVDIEELSVTPRFVEVKGSVSSLRLDAILALGFRQSRTAMTPHISNGEVFVNSRQVTSASHVLKDKDIVSARGYGKFIFDGLISQTKKGRYMVLLRRFD